MNFLAELVLCRAGGFPLILYTACEKTDCPGAMRTAQSRQSLAAWVYFSCVSAQQAVSVANTVLYITHHKYNNRSHLVIFLHMADQLQSTKW